MDIEAVKLLGLAIAVGAGMIGPAIGLGNIFGKMIEAVGRNPEAQGKLSIQMWLGVAFVEALAIFALVFGIIIWKG